jgi:hypothetical protein
MPIYIVVPLFQDPASLNKAVISHIPNETDRYQLQANRGWLIQFSGTTVELSNHLTITGQEKGEKSPVGSAIILPIV